MSESPKDLSRDSLELLVARAIEIDEQGSQRLSLTKAREIGRELGISEAAWNAALAERARATPASAPVVRRTWVQLRTLATAAAGFGARSEERRVGKEWRWRGGEATEGEQGGGRR